MPWNQLFKRPTTETIKPEQARQPPPQLSPEDAQRLEMLKRKRRAVLYDIEQGELATLPDNPWTQRIDLLALALTDVERERQASTKIEPSPFAPVPPTPVTWEISHERDVFRIAIAVGNERITFEEQEDWAERGHQLARPELNQTSDNVADLVPNSIPEALREPFRFHLEHSLAVLAADLRDHILNEEPIPAGVTLADLAMPCPICGGWTDWRGTCQTCALGQATTQQLTREYTKLLDDRTKEAEERHKLVERLPLARRRLHDTDIEISALTQT